MLRLALTKNLDELNAHNIREIAAVKCVFDFKVAFNKFTGDSNKAKKYLKYALHLHQSLTREHI